MCAAIENGSTRRSHATTSRFPLLQQNMGTLDAPVARRRAPHAGAAVDGQRTSGPASASPTPSQPSQLGDDFVAALPLSELSALPRVTTTTQLSHHTHHVQLQQQQYHTLSAAQGLDQGVGFMPLSTTAQAGASWLAHPTQVRTNLLTPRPPDSTPRVFSARAVPHST